MPNEDYTCDYCGRAFMPTSTTIKKIKDGKQKTLACSIECASHLKRRTVTTQCDNCGKEIQRKKSHYERQKQLGQHQFCSLTCEKDFQHKETHEMRACEICGKIFECAKISSKRFCSPQCQGKWQSTQTGDLNPRSTKIHQICDWCGQEFLMKQYKTNSSKKHFCSSKCMHNWFNNVFAKTPEFKIKSTKRAVKILSSGQIPSVNTTPQLIVNQILDDLSIKYQNEYDIVYYTIDNYLCDHHLMIEVMGDYWHSNPNKFSFDRLNKTQRLRVVKDRAKRTYIENQYHVSVLYLWESDIKTNPLLCKLLILQYINDNGILRDYHSFNYSLVNDELRLNDSVILPFFDNTYQSQSKKVS